MEQQHGLLWSDERIASAVSSEKIYITDAIGRGHDVLDPQSVMRLCQDIKNEYEALRAQIQPPQQSLDPMHNHKCRVVARAICLEKGRDYWIGELLEPIPGYPNETHCLHITTPARSFAMGLNLGDATALAVFAQVIHGPMNQEWLASMERAYRIKAKDAK